MRIFSITDRSRMATMIFSFGFPGPQFGGAAEVVGLQPESCPSAKTVDGRQ